MCQRGVTGIRSVKQTSMFMSCSNGNKQYPSQAVVIDSGILTCGVILVSGKSTSPDSMVTGILITL